MSKRPTRSHTVTEKIDKTLTGLKASVYIHVSHSRSGKIHSVECSYKWKDDQDLDPVFRALSDAITEAVLEAQTPMVYAFPPVTKWKAKGEEAGK